MPEDEKEIEQSNVIVNLVEKFLKFIIKTKKD